MFLRAILYGFYLRAVFIARVAIHRETVALDTTELEQSDPFADTQDKDELF
jgi:hypothetical protein